MNRPERNIFAHHDHQDCRSGALSAARQACEDKGLRLTPIRSRVLEILLESHKALGAYDILARLRAEGLGDKPPVAYRALDFLVANGFAHRLEKLNAFSACASHHDGHDPAFLICETCRRVAEIPLGPLEGALDGAAADMGFAVSARMVEITGLCPDCRDEAAHV